MSPLPIVLAGAAAAAVMPTAVQAQVISSSDRLADRLARELPQELPGDTLFAAKVQPPPPTKNEVTIGVDYTHLYQGGRAWTLPFEWDYAMNRQWLFVLSTGAESDAPSGAPKASGLDDVNVAATYRFAAIGHLKLGLTVGYQIPVHGEVGSDAGAEKLALVGVYQVTADVKAKLSASARRGDGAVPAGASRYLQQGKAGVEWDLASGSSLSLAMQRSHSGSTGRTSAQAIFGLPLTGSYSMAFALGRVLTGSAKNTDAEVDLAIDF